MIILVHNGHIYYENSVSHIELIILHFCHFYDILCHSASGIASDTCLPLLTGVKIYAYYLLFNEALCITHSITSIWHHDITEILLKVALNTIILLPVLDVIFSSNVRSTEELMSSHVHRCPMLTFAFRANVDKLLGPRLMKFHM